MTTWLDFSRDGIRAIDLGIIDGSQFALSVVAGMKADVWRRKASEAGTYGGWRWECSSLHVANYSAIFPELSRRVRAAKP